MAAPGRGRGESANIGQLDMLDIRTVEERRRALETASAFGMSEGDIPIRGRGGFRQAELRTIPTNVNTIRANLDQVRTIEVLANYVPIVTKKDAVLQMYRVDFKPPVESQQQMRMLFRAAARSTFTRLPMYDGVHECRSNQKLDQQLTEVPVKIEKEEYTVAFTHTGVTAGGLEMLRTYNIHMKEFFRLLGYYQPQPGLSVHPNQSTACGQDIMILRGYRTAANAHDEKRTLMNFEGSHKLMQKKNVLDYMEVVRANLRGGNLQEALRTALVGKLVITSYNKRAYRIEDIEFSKNPQSTFEKRGGGEMRYSEYFQSTYNLPIRNNNQPLLVVVPNNMRRRGDEQQDHVIHLVPELCNIAGLTDNQKNDNRLKMDLIKATQISPQDRVTHLREFLRAFHANAEIQQQLASWGYSYATDALKIKGYCIVPTKIGSGPQAAGPTDRWPNVNPESGDFRVNALAVAPSIESMAVVCGQNCLQSKNQILGTLKRGFEQVGLKVDNVVMCDITDGDRPNDYTRKLKQLPRGTTLALVIVRNQNKPLYDAIKKAACAEMGLVTQVVTERLMTDQRKASSAATKIAIQVAAKVGGEPWWADIPLRGTMICGYDTYHDTANRGKSFGAFLASMNDRFSKWYSKADQHDKLDEMSTQIATNMLEALKAYQQKNNQLPDRIVIYRDGVGEGQIEHVFKTETAAIKKSIDSLGGKMRMTMIIVNKRIGARFYQRAQDGRFINPPPGSVIDHSATRANRYDFYLISQSTRHGTITPTYYNIIHDECGFGPEIHQKMALKLCFLYYNWTGSVRVPAPCQYAHKLALLCGEHVHAQPNAALNDRLHFL